MTLLCHFDVNQIQESRGGMKTLNEGKKSGLLGVKIPIDNVILSEANVSRG